MRCPTIESSHSPVDLKSIEITINQQWQPGRGRREKVRRGREGGREGGTEEGRGGEGVQVMERDNALSHDRIVPLPPLTLEVTINKRW